MSHRPFQGSIFSNARVWAFLKQVDEAEAARCRSTGCAHCGAVLHSATYPRKPHGLAPELREDARRLSFCCADCRRRVKPPSVRFFGRRFRVAPLFLVVSALALTGGVRLQTIARRWGVPAATLKRWRRWWLEAFPVTRQWRAKRGELAAPPEEAPLRWLLRVMRGRGLRSRLLRTLDIAVIDVPTLRLDHRLDRQRLLETVERVGPRLLVLDPLVRLHGVDENTVAEIAPILGFLRELQRRFEAAVVFVHHARKSGATRPGQALRGTSELHAWGDSNLYLRRRDAQIVMTVEHRAAPGLNDVEIELADDSEGPALRLRRPVPAETAPQPETPEQRIVAALVEAATPLSQRQIRERAATRPATVAVNGRPSREALPKAVTASNP